jgi:Uma2 family endonuclease
VFVTDLEEARTSDWSSMQTLLLVVEVLSPGTARQDRFAKRRLYQEAGAALYWIVNPDEKTVEVWTPEARFPAVERRRVVWTPQSANAAFELRLEELFKPV